MIGVWLRERTWQLGIGTTVRFGKEQEMKIFIQMILSAGVVVFSSSAFAQYSRAWIYNDWQYAHTNRCEISACALDDGGQKFVRECRDIINLRRGQVVVFPGYAVFELYGPNQKTCFCDCP